MSVPMAVCLGVLLAGAAGVQLLIAALFRRGLC